MRLLRVINSGKAQLEAKLGVRAVQIEHFQEGSRQMRLAADGSGWVAGQSGQDPNGTDDITGVRTARGLDNSDDYQGKITAFLKEEQSIYWQAIAHIDNYLANVQKAKVNKLGNTSGVQKVNTNDKSGHPGSRGDLLNTPAKLKERLEFVKRERKEVEEKLELQAELEKERKLYWDARVKTLRKQDGQSTL